MNFISRCLSKSEQIITIYWSGVKWFFIHRGDLEIFYFASDEGASKIIVRESPSCIKPLSSRLIPNFIFVW